MKKCMDADNLHRRIKKIIGQLNAIDRINRKNRWEQPEKLYKQRQPVDLIYF